MTGGSSGRSPPSSLGRWPPASPDPPQATALTKTSNESRTIICKNLLGIKKRAFSGETARNNKKEQENIPQDFVLFLAFSCCFPRERSSAWPRVRAHRAAQALELA